MGEPSINALYKHSSPSKTKTYLLGLCNAFKCQPLDDMISLTSNMSRSLDPNATIVMSGLPMINNSGISLIL